MLKVIDGFDTYENVPQMLRRSGYLQWTGLISTAVSLIEGRSGTGSKALHFQQSNFSAAPLLRGSFASNMNVGYVGFALKVLTLFSGDGIAKVDTAINLVETNSGAIQGQIVFNGKDGSITYPGGRTGNNLFPVDSWFFAEFGWVASKSGGSLRVRVNGVLVVNVTGINLSPGTTNEWVNGLEFPTDYLRAFDIDDLYVCDSVSGPGTYPCNTFIGDRRVYTLRVTGAGSHTGWTPSAGANWQNVRVQDDDATYNSTSTAGAEDSFFLESLPSAVSAVIGVQVTGSYKKDDATQHFLTQRLISGGQDVPGVGFLAPYSLSSSYVSYSDLFMVDPATNASWTLGALASGTIQIGYKLES